MRRRASAPLVVCLLALGLAFGCGVDQLVGLDTTDTDGGTRDGGRRDGGDDDGDGGDEAVACLVVTDAGRSPCPPFASAPAQ